MPNWIDNRALWEMYDPGPRFLGGLQAGAQVGNLMLRAREQALMLPLQEQMYKNQAKAQDLAAQHSLLQIQQQSLMLQNERDTLPLKLQAVQDTAEDQKKLAEARLQWSLGNRVEPSLKTEQGAAAWQQWKGKTTMGQSLTNEAGQYQNLANSILTPRIKARVDLIPKGEGGMRYGADQWDALYAAVEEDKSARVQAFESEKAQFYRNAKPGERRTLVDPLTGKSTVITQPIVGQGGAIGGQVENAVTVKINQYRDEFGQEPDPEMIDQFRYEAYQEAMTSRRTPLSHSIARTQATGIQKEITALNTELVKNEQEITLLKRSLAVPSPGTNKQEVEKAIATFTSTVDRLKTDIAAKKAELEKLKVVKPVTITPATGPTPGISYFDPVTRKIVTTPPSQTVTTPSPPPTPEEEEE